MLLRVVRGLFIANTPFTVFHVARYLSMAVRFFGAVLSPCCLLPGCIRVPFNDLVGLEQALHSQTVAAFIVEPIQGKSVNLPTADYLKSAADLCRRYGTLFVADEVQTGLGRTGRFLAVEHWAVEPVLLAKTLSASRSHSGPQEGIRQGL